LQILRLYGRKIKRTDAILIMLFLNGRGVKPYEVREALGREFARGRAKLNAQARSSRFDESGPIPPKHEESLIRALGKADERLVASNLVPTSNEMIEAVRTARRFEQDYLKPTLNSSRMAGSALSTLLPVFSGLLAYDDEFGGEIEDLLSKATDQQIEQARLILLQIALTFSSGKVKSDQVSITPMAEAFLAALKEPVFVANLLVVMLRLSTLAAALPFEELLKAYDFSLAKE
jgi:hypothetical protein